MKTVFRKNPILSFAAVLTAALFLMLIPAKKAAAATPEQVTQKVMQYYNTVTSNGTQKAFWNKHYFANTLIEQTNRGDYLSQITRSPCSVTPGAEHLYVNGCTSNNWYGYSQCWGFTLYMGYLTSGAVHEGPEYGTRYYSVPDNFTFRPGDHIRFGWRENGTTATHSIFVYKVENGTVHIIECNWGENCRIGLRSFPESTVRWFVNRFNGGDNSDFLFRPYSVSPEPVTRSDTVWYMAGGFTKGEGKNGDNTAFVLLSTSVSAKAGSTFTLSAGAPANLPNGYGAVPRLITKDISGSWEWYDLPREIKQPDRNMELSCWYAPIEYTISYEMNGGVNHEANPDSYNVLYGADFRRPKRDGFLFAGWMIGQESATGINRGEANDFATTNDMVAALAERTTGDVTATALWKPAPPPGAEPPQRGAIAEMICFGE